MNIYIYTYTFIYYLIRCVNIRELTSSKKKNQKQENTDCVYTCKLRVRSYSYFG